MNSVGEAALISVVWLAYCYGVYYFNVLPPYSKEWVNNYTAKSARRTRSKSITDYKVEKELRPILKSIYNRASKGYSCDSIHKRSWLLDDSSATIIASIARLTDMGYKITRYNNYIVVSW